MNKPPSFVMPWRDGRRKGESRGLWVNLQSPLERSVVKLEEI